MTTCSRSIYFSHIVLNVYKLLQRRLHNATNRINIYLYHVLIRRNKKYEFNFRLFRRPHKKHGNIQISYSYIEMECDNNVRDNEQPCINRVEQVTYCYVQHIIWGKHGTGVKVAVGNSVHSHRQRSVGRNGNDTEESRISVRSFLGWTNEWNVVSHIKDHLCRCW